MKRMHDLKAYWCFVPVAYIAWELISPHPMGISPVYLGWALAFCLAAMVIDDMWVFKNELKIPEKEKAQVNEFAIHVRPSDVFFYDSPDAGEPNCTCSRCYALINEGEMVFRWPIDTSIIRRTIGSRIHGEELLNGTEFRLCQKCAKEAYSTYQYLINFQNPSDSND